MVDRLLGAGHARHLVGDLADIAEPHRRRGGVGGGIVAFKLCVGAGSRRQRLGLPFVVDGGSLFLVCAGHERRIGRVDAIDHIAEVFAVANRLIGGKGGSRESHVSYFLDDVRLRAALCCATRNCSAIARKPVSALSM